MDWLSAQQQRLNMSCITRKPVFGASHQVGHNRVVQPQKMARDLKFWI